MWNWVEHSIFSVSVALYLPEILHKSLKPLHYHQLILEHSAEDSISQILKFKQKWKFFQSTKLA